MANTSTASRVRLQTSGVDALAIKPTEVDVAGLANGEYDTLAGSPATDALVVDFEGRDAVPDAETLATLAERVDTLRVTTPVRADGFDPLGDDSVSEAIPDAASRVLVAGHPAYLDEHEARRAVAPRLREAVDSVRDDAGTGQDSADPWVGTEGIERLALAVGATQFELLAPGVERDVRALRATGYSGEVAVYAPTVLTNDEDTVLDAVGDYVARREPVVEALPAGAPTDSTATGDARRILSSAARDYALVGDVATVRERTETLREAGVDHVVAYPAAGLGSILD